MDDVRETSLPAPAKARRRYHPPEFKQKIVNLASQPGVSVAALAQEYQLNANLIHRWCRDLEDKPPSREFIPLSVPERPELHETVRIELGAVTIHWPLSQIHQAIPLLKALQS
jgi:transposase-like protein